MFGFLVYSASVNSEDWAHFIQLAEIKLVEDIISTYRVAQSKGFPIEYVPYVPPSLTAVTVSKDEATICTLTYNALNRLREDNTTLHQMDVFILDTGIQSSHRIFEGRVVHGYDALTSPPLRNDPHGHGTQVAGIVGGQRYGINSLVKLIDVRIANSEGCARTDDIIAGLDFAVGFHMRKPFSSSLSSVINLSLSGPQSKVLEFALYLASKVMLIIAANGDENSFSCWKSPSSSDYVVSVGAVSGATDMAMHESNYGDCVDILAPGEDIPAPYIGPSNNDFRPLSGTSAATAVTTGIVTRLIGVIERNVTIKDALQITYKDTMISQFLKTTLTSSKYTIFNQTDTVHLNLYLACDFSVLHAMEDIFAQELKLGRKKNIHALNRARKALLDIHSKQKAAMFEE